MKRILIVCISFFLLIIFSCKKYNEVNDNLKGNDFIRGRVFIDNSLNGSNLNSSKSNIVVKISIENSGDNFLYSLSSDSEGYFMFKNLTKEIKYSVFAEVTIDTIVYTNRCEVYAGNDSLVLLLSPKNTEQNILKYEIVGPNDEPVLGCNLCMYNNAIQALDTNCIGSYWNTSSNKYGVAYKLNLPEGTYYTNFKIKYNNVNYLLKDTIHILKEGIVTKRVKLLPSIENKIAYKITDSLGNIVSNCSVCGFTSSILSNDSCLNANWSINSLANGVASVSKIPTGNYYVFFKIKVGNNTFYSNDTVYNFSNSTIYEKTITLKKR